MPPLSTVLPALSLLTPEERLRAAPGVESCGSPVSPSGRGSSGGGRAPADTPGIDSFRSRTPSGAIPWRALAGLSRPLCEALGPALEGSAPAERQLDKLLRQRKPAPDARQRQALAEALFGVSLWRRRLAYHLGAPHSPEASISATRGSLASRDGRLPTPPEWLLFSLLRDLAQLPAAEAAQLAEVPLDLAPPVRPPPESFADRHSFPDALAALIQSRFPEPQAAEKLAHALNVPGPICARVNLLKSPSREHLAEVLRREGVDSIPTPFSPLGLLLEGRPNVYGLAAHQAGLFEIQDEGSQLLGLLLDAQPGETILDFCAGSGGKTLLLAGQVKNQGKLAAHDTDADALVHRLLPRAARAGVQGLSLFRGGEIPEGFLADAVLVDAPCSALGSLRRSPDLRFREGPEAWAQLPALQSQILAAAARHVRPGGRLLYATCTFRPEENDEVALHFERAHPAFQRVPTGQATAGADAASSIPWLLPSFLREGFFETWPHLHGTDAFFAASYRRMV